MKWFLQDTAAPPSSQDKAKDTASGSSAALQDTCWKRFKDVDREASEKYWYVATCIFCAERMRLKTGPARAHSGCPTGHDVRTCSRYRQKSEVSFCQPIVVGTARLQDKSQHTLREALASRDLIELDRDIDCEYSIVTSLSIETLTANVLFIINAVTCLQTEFCTQNVQNVSALDGRLQCTCSLSAVLVYIPIGHAAAGGLCRPRPPPPSQTDQNMAPLAQSLCMNRGAGSGALGFGTGSFEEPLNSRCLHGICVSACWFVPPQCGYNRVKGTSHSVEERISMHLLKPHATSQPSLVSHTHSVTAQLAQPLTRRHTQVPS